MYAGLGRCDKMCQHGSGKLHAFPAYGRSSTVSPAQADRGDSVGLVSPRNSREEDVCSGLAMQVCTASVICRPCYCLTAGQPAAVETVDVDGACIHPRCACVRVRVHGAI